MSRHRIAAGIARICILSVMLPFAAQAQSGPRLQVVYPKEGDVLTAQDSAFVFGNVHPENTPVWVNGIRARKYRNGTFLVMVPIHSGDFVFHCLAVHGGDSTTVLRSVTIPAYLSTGPQDTLGFDTTFVYPQFPLEVEPGDRINLVCKGTPGMRAFVTLGGVAPELPMVELEPRRPFYWGEAVFGKGAPSPLPEVKGLYGCTYTIQPDDPAGLVPVQFTLESAEGSAVSFLAPGWIEIRKDPVPRVAEVDRELTVARTGPGKGYQLFLPAGVRLWISGREGKFYRARLSQTLDVCVPSSALRMLPQGTPVPTSEVVLARTERLPDRVRLKIFLQERLPFGVEQMTRPQRLVLRLYGAVSNTDWIRHDFGDRYVDEIRWQQESNDVYRLDIRLNGRQQWGYRAYYEGTNLFLEIRRPPAGGRGGALRGLVICVDPGHGPDLGALGPTGLAEKDATLAYAHTLKELLEKKGAIVVLTREDGQGVALAARTRIAEAVNANLFVSLHFNALPDGVNPFASRGVSTYYYHAQSYTLAKYVQKQLLRRTKLPNFGLYYDNLAVCRVTWMPSILVEPAFIMHPVEEMKILDRKFRKRVCEGIVKGLEEFIKRGGGT